jgi:hypothetical protein
LTSLRARRLVHFARLKVGHGRGGEHQAARHFGAGGEAEQQALHIAMAIDGDGRSVSLAALAPLGGIAPGEAGCGAGQAGSLATHRQAHADDHREQLRQAAPRRADEMPDRAFKAERAGGRAMEPQLLLDPPHDNRIAHPS